MKELDEHLKNLKYFWTEWNALKEERIEYQDKHFQTLAPIIEGKIVKSNTAYNDFQKTIINQFQQVEEQSIFHPLKILKVKLFLINLNAANVIYQKYKDNNQNYYIKKIKNKYPLEKQFIISTLSNGLLIKKKVFKQLKIKKDSEIMVCTNKLNCIKIQPKISNSNQIGLNICKQFGIEIDIKNLKVFERDENITNTKYFRHHNEFSFEKTPLIQYDPSNYQWKNIFLSKDEYNQHQIWIQKHKDKIKKHSWWEKFVSFLTSEPLDEFSKYPIDFKE